jgi:hypothetical protein
MSPQIALQYSEIEPFTPDGIILLKKLMTQDMAIQ